MSAAGRHCPALVLASALAAVAVVACGAGPPLRPVVVLWFVFVCPGLAVVRAARLDDRLAEAVLAVALSVGIAGATSGALMYGRSWSPERVLVVLVVVSTAGAVLEWRAALAEKAR